MSDFALNAAISRMNMGVLAVAPFHGGLAHDMKSLAGLEASAIESRFDARKVEMVAAYGFNANEQRKPFAFANGVAIIPISGTLINRYNYTWEGYVTGYNFIRRQLQAAMADDDVKGIIFDVNSYGGEAAGCFELASEIRAAREAKPSIALVDSNAYSAGYALASAAGKVVAIPSAGVGSIGVITMHVDFSKLYEDVGIKVTLIYESEHKADGNPYEPLPEAVKSSIQKSIHSAYEAFVGLVAENLGVDAKMPRDTKSATFQADEALKLGLIHAVATPQMAARAFLNELSGSNSNPQGASMSTQTTNEPGAETQATAEAAAAAATTARNAERERVNGILSCEEAKGRETLAKHLALETEMSVDAAKKVLAASEAKASTGNPFAAAMDATKNPNVGADAANNGGAEEDPVKAILSAQAAATGRKVA